MDKLRKIGLVLWQNKERMLLVFLVGVLAYRVYKVMTDKSVLPELPVARAAASGGDELPVSKEPPKEGSSENYSSLSQRNPFWYYSARPETASTEGTSAEEEIHLLNIQRSPKGGYAAQIQTRDVRWYQEGEEFESYQVMKIDPASRSVEVYSGKSGTTLTLTMR
jgi:hypothetical protein